MPNFWLNYHHLFYFKTIAEEGGVSKAAEKLRLGQPTLSAQLRQFEESLDVRLFERKHKRLILSEHGKVALEYAKNIFRTGNEMYEVLRDQKISAKIHVQIGNLDTIPKQIMLSLTKTAFKVRECFVTITEGRMDELLRELLTHRLDLMVSNFVPTSTEARGLNFRSIAKKPVAIFGSSKFRSLRRNFPQSLIGMKFIFPTFDSKIREDVEHWMRLHKITVDAIAETQDMGLKKMMATDGIGLISAGTHTVTRQVLAGDLIEIGRLNGVTEELFLISAQRKIVNPVAAELMRSFRI